LLATRIAEKLGNAIVAPVIAYVPEGSIAPPAAHMRFSGTITIADTTFEAVLASTAESFRLHGFRDIVFLGDHGSYQADLARVATALDHKWAGSSARAHAIPEYYRAATQDYERILAKRGIPAAESGSHAGLADTSLMLALDPSTVRMSALAGAPAPTLAQGVHGDPRHASAELGALGVDAIVNTTVAAIRAATARH
jgi:creatinine amidohydrolase/Fe(II)-dependent formamide hydrolase-like protein